jgi:membrane protease YdiL (CAAX protease family)
MINYLTIAIKKYPLATFFMFTFALTWIGSTIYYFGSPMGGQILPSILTTPSSILWYYGPCLSAIMITRVTGGKSSVRRFLKRLLDWRLSWKWYAFIILYPLGLHLAVVYGDLLLGGPTPVFFHAEGVPTGNKWLVLIGLVIFQILMRGIGEETGWRGYALPALQSRWNSLISSLILGAFWCLWHLHPANFSLLSTSGIFLLGNIFATTILYTWVYNHTNGSIFVAAFFHMTLNVAEFVVPIGMTEAGLTRNLLQIAVLIITLTVLLLVSGPDLGAKRLEKQET